MGEFIENWETQDEPEHLRTIRDRILGDRQNATGLLHKYQEIIQQGNISANNSPEQAKLLLSGLVTKKDERLIVSNRIYATIFNCDWIAKELAKLK